MGRVDEVTRALIPLRPGLPVRVVASSKTIDIYPVKDASYRLKLGEEMMGVLIKSIPHSRQMRTLWWVANVVEADDLIDVSDLIKRSWQLRIAGADWKLVDEDDVHPI